MSAFPSPFKSAMRADEGPIPTVVDVALNESVLRGVAMGNAAGFDTPPPGAGLATVMVAVLATATSAAAMDAVSCDALTNVVVRGLPFQWTTEAETNPVPLTVRVNPGLPGATAVGIMG
jgi:predicted anti-sigma-YlaC factor YlaD